MNARTFIVISCVLLVAAGIDVVRKELTETSLTIQNPNGCSCITMVRAAPQMVFTTTALPTSAKEGVAASDRLWQTIVDMTASSANVEEVISSYSTKGSQE